MDAVFELSKVSEMTAVKLLPVHNDYKGLPVHLKTFCEKPFQWFACGSYDDLHSLMREIVARNQLVVVEGCIGAGKSTLCREFSSNRTVKIYYEPSTSYFFDVSEDFTVFKFQTEMLESRSIETQWHDASLKQTVLFDTGIRQDYAFAKQTLSKIMWTKYLELFNKLRNKTRSVRIFIETTDKQSYENVQNRQQIIGVHMTENMDWIKRSNGFLKLFTKPYADYIFKIKVPKRRRYTTCATPPYWLRSGRGIGRFGDLPGGITSTVQKNI
jgi:deoxyadenosine/deoxycytidine kinase